MTNERRAQLIDQATALATGAARRTPFARRGRALIHALGALLARIAQASAVNKRAANRYGDEK